jgi:hypothetical protein
VRLPTWKSLTESYCSVSRGNPYHEEFATRRYNYSPTNDRYRCRLIFLKGVSEDPRNKTLRRHGRFIWCKNMVYEGRGTHGFREVSFTVDEGHKRFQVSENNILCIPSKTYVNNNKYFRSALKTFLPFSSVFAYRHTLWMMHQNSTFSRQDLEETIKAESPYRAGTLVAPRLGYFHPEAPLPPSCESTHPCGIVLGPSALGENPAGKEFYRVRFAGTTYEKVHPVQLEIINEV